MTSQFYNSEVKNSSLVIKPCSVQWDFFFLNDVFKGETHVICSEISLTTSELTAALLSGRSDSMLRLCVEKRMKLGDLAV